MAATGAVCKQERTATAKPLNPNQQNPAQQCLTMKPLTIELSKSADGAVVLRYVRGDGSVTWQKQGGKPALFFPLHDLTHFAVETVLEARQGFYGLIAAGWDIGHTTGKGAKGPVPDEAMAVEHLVGMLDAERASGAIMSAAELNEHAAAYAKKNHFSAKFALTDKILERIRSQTADLHSRWIALPVGETMALEFAIHG